MTPEEFAALDNGETAADIRRWTRQYLNTPVLFPPVGIPPSYIKSAGSVVLSSAEARFMERIHRPPPFAHGLLDANRAQQAWRRGFWTRQRNRRVEAVLLVNRDEPAALAAARTIATVMGTGTNPYDRARSPGYRGLVAERMRESRKMRADAESRCG